VTDSQTGSNRKDSATGFRQILLLPEDHSSVPDDNGAFLQISGPVRQLPLLLNRLYFYPENNFFAFTYL